MKVKCTSVVQRIVTKFEERAEETDHLLEFDIGNDMTQTMWLQLSGPPIFEVGKTYILDETPYD